MPEWGEPEDFINLAVGALVGIILNAVLPGKDYVFDEEEPTDTGVNFAVMSKEKTK